MLSVAQTYKMTVFPLQRGKFQNMTWDLLLFPDVDIVTLTFLLGLVRLSVRDIADLKLS